MRFQATTPEAKAAAQAAYGPKDPEVEEKMSFAKSIASFWSSDSSGSASDDQSTDR